MNNSNSKILPLEAIRGIAAIFVMLFHSNFIYNEKNYFFANCDIFVDLFFILSGFVMSFAYKSKIENNYSFFLFIKKRIARLYPLHIFTLILWVFFTVVKYLFFILYGIGRNPLILNNWKNFITNVFLIHSLGIHNNLSWNTPSWSISVEFYVYIVFYLILSKIKCIKKDFIFFLLSIFFYYILYISTDNTLLSTYKLGFIRCLAGFSLGVWLCFLSKNKKVFLKNNFIIDILLIIAVFTGVYYANNKQIELLCIALFAIIILYFSNDSPSFLKSLLKKKPFLFCGKVSFSVYMIHLLIFGVAGNIYNYIFKFPIKNIVINNEVIIYYNTSYAFIINLVLITFTLFFSNVIYKKIEIPMQKKIISFKRKNN